MKTLLRILLLSLFVTACGDDDIIVLPTPTFSPTPEPTSVPTPSNPVCTRVMGTDGPGGFLWKPEADATSSTPFKLVVLFPGRFIVQFRKVEAERSRGGFDELRGTGFANPEANGQERQHWRGDTSGKNYTGYLRATSPDGKVCEWRVARPSRRQD